MMRRLLSGAVMLVSAGCTTPATDAAPQPEAWACRDAVRTAAVQAYALARFSDDRRAVLLLPAGKGAVDYEAATKRLPDEGARLLAVLKSNDPDADTIAPPAPVSPDAMTEVKVAAGIAGADACVAKAAE